MSPSPRIASALVAAAAVVLLAGCVAQPAARSAAGATAAPASAQRFTCPTAVEVAALAAVPLTAGTSTSSGCTYTAAADGQAAATVTVRHPGAPSGAALAGLRYAAIEDGATTADLEASGFDAFTAATDGDCTAWFTAVDGVVTSVTARSAGAAGTTSCRAASAVATLVGSGTASSAPVVAVVAPERLLGATTDAARWPWRIGRDAGVRVDRLTGSGYLDPTADTSFAGVAATVPADSVAVVVVSGTEEAGASSLDIVTGVTAALSSAAVRAPDAELVVVGPVADGSTPYARLADLRAQLRSAAGIAKARYLDPTASAYATPGTAALDALADQVTEQLADAGIGAR